jgi:23S rRNA (uridine2552-2'-O)-methyltransferase
LSIPQTVSAYTRKDAAYREAKRSGYRSRAAIKLIDLDRKFRLFAPAARVIDLGCWPGGWLQVAAERVGARGRVVGVDVEPTALPSATNVTVIQGDAGDAGVRRRTLDALGGRADLLLSDMAPKLSGVKIADHERLLALVGLAIEWASEVLAPNGRAVVKLFSDVEGEASKMLAAAFFTVARHRPPATRKGSSEIYAIAARPRIADAGRRPERG